VLAKQGIEVRSSTPSEMTAVIKADLARWAHVVKEANIKAE
jgi:tripartite-type tricarboxylate transporter receptor subunit TctC